MSTLKIDQVEELTTLQSLSYIRPTELKLTGSLLKPSTRYNLFFDGQNVNHLTTPDGGAKGDPLISSADGIIFATLSIPGFKFAAGQKRVVLTQENNIISAAGANVSRADAIYTTFTNDDMYNVSIDASATTVSEVLTKDIVIPVHKQVPLDDAIAQSFFTYGIDSGIFVTSIELFFKTKDTLLPVWVELREMINGFPSKEYISPYSTSFKTAATVTVSDNASVATKFTFPKLIFLPQDKEFCFVVRSRSNNYSLWTSSVGESSVETGNVVTEQPYTGSLFKTDNNSTWSTEQLKDIKFTINRAEFATNVISNLKFPLFANHVISDGTRLSTLVESKKVVLAFPHKHGLVVGDLIRLACDPDGTYNGVSGSNINDKTVQVQSLVSGHEDYAVSFEIPGLQQFTSTGPIKTGGRIKNIVVTNGGSGYTSGTPPLVTISAPSSGGVPALATAVVENGSVVRIEVTDPGTNYNGAVTITIGNPDVGTNKATAIAQNNALIGVATNRVYQAIAPTFAYSKPDGTSINTSLVTSKTASFSDGVVSGSGISNYGVNNAEYQIKVGEYNKLDNNLLLASRFNEEENLSNAPSCMIEVELASTKKTVSPVIELDDANFVAYGNRINNLLPGESITSTNSSGSLATISVTSSGSGYIAPPRVSILGGRGAVARAVLNNSGGVSEIIIENPGKFFFNVPGVALEKPATGTPATATATITPFNSELLPNNGSAMAKYVTKPQTIENIANAIRVYVTAYSNKNSSFEVYLKSSLSSSSIPHEENEWMLLTCDTARNKSERELQEFEYEFYADNLTGFDVYSLKIVLRSITPWDPPYVSNYRAIILA